jgi:FkbM family methyltransferase
MSIVSTVWSDVSGIRRSCGWTTALSWGLCLMRSARDCLSAHNLQPADRLMGRGPFRARRGAARAALLGDQAFSGLREIWVRDVYLRDDYLCIEPHSTVVDLGANLGNFTLLALAHSGVRVLAVEPSRRLSESLERAVAFNGWSDRLQLARVFVGEMTEVQHRALTSDPEYAGVPCMPEAELLQLAGLQRVDFLKCDIEGSEFFLLEAGSHLLSITRQIAVEIHPWGGKVETFVQALKVHGFHIGPVRHDASGCCIALARKPG